MYINLSFVPFQKCPTEIQIMNLYEFITNQTDASFVSGIKLAAQCKKR